MSDPIVATYAKPELQLVRINLHQANLLKMMPVCFVSIIMLAISGDVVGKSGANLRGLQEPDTRSNTTAIGPLMSAGGSNVSVFESSVAASPSAQGWERYHAFVRHRATVQYLSEFKPNIVSTYPTDVCGDITRALDCGSPESYVIELTTVPGQADTFYIRNRWGDYLDSNSGNSVDWWQSPDGSTGSHPANIQWKVHFAEWAGESYFHIMNVAHGKWLDSGGPGHLGLSQHLPSGNHYLMMWSLRN